MGWSMDTASKMIKTYAQVDAEITDTILAKLKRNESAQAK
jgi:hypothetical protein